MTRHLDPHHPAHNPDDPPPQHGRQHRQSPSPRTTPPTAEYNTADQHHALLALILTPGLGPRVINRSLRHFPSPAHFAHASADAWAHALKASPARATKLRHALDAILAQGRLDDEYDALDRCRAHLLAITDDDYPKLLRLIPDPPPLLFIRGQLTPADALALAMVGSRRCSSYGREQAGRLAAAAASAGLTVVSGGAYGIDAAAHHGAIRAQGRTIAVIGSGLANPYPTQHAQLFQSIAEQHGAVISELPINTPPRRQNFPARNRIISGLSLGVLVVEAAVRSGALITARSAVEDHNRPVMAMPGPVDSTTSAGCHQMIRQGWAALVTNLSDMLDALGDVGQTLQATLEQQTHAPQPNPTPSINNDQPSAPPQPQQTLFNAGLSDSQRQLLDALAHGPRSLDNLANDTNLPIPVIQADLTMLQVRSLIEPQSHGRFARKR